MCVDGLDPDYCKKLGVRMPYESKLSIPPETFINGSPWTPNVWGSIFTGKISKYPIPNILQKEFFPSPIRRIRLKIRHILRNWGLQYNREGIKFKTENRKEEDIGRFFFNASYRKRQCI